MYKNTSILIVDDNKVLLHMMEEGLSLAGYYCKTADNANSALKLLKEKPFSFMIVDIDLPDMNGLELTKKAKTLHPALAVIIITGFIKDFSYDDAINIGATDFIKKPFTPKELIVSINQLEMQGELRRREEELQKKVKELEEFYNIAVGRELRMMELKKEIKNLRDELEKCRRPQQ